MKTWVITASVWIDAETEEERDEAAEHMESNGDEYIGKGIQVRLHTNEKEWEEV